MGTDLFTSARGPGVIGLLLALIVLGGFGLLAMMVFEGMEESSGASPAVTLAQDAKTAEILRENIASARKQIDDTKGLRKVASEITDFELAFQSAKNLVADLEDRKSAAEATVMKAAEALSDYKRQYRKSARDSLVGKTYETLKTQSGKTYSNVSVTEVDLSRVQVRHSSGVTGIPLVELPDEIQEFLQIDTAEIEQHVAAEKERANDRNVRTDVAEQQMKINKLELELRMLQDEETSAKQFVAKQEAALEGLRQRIEDKRMELAADPGRSGRGGISNAPQIEGQIRNLESAKRAAEQALPKARQAVDRKSAEASAVEQQIAEARETLRKMAIQTTTEE
jgi:predicted  nucleic acid-binding Zn-ribbon protein